MSIVSQRQPTNLLPTQPLVPLHSPTPVRASSIASSSSYLPSTSLSTRPESPRLSPPRRPPSRTERRFICDYPGCDKAYFKPSRLAEHQLTHTGERPHTCPHCSQSYLRSSHLHAHLRTHLTEDDKPFSCTFEGCTKRFWTSTHLKRHQAVHDNIDIYKCEQCSETFAKAHLLRDHVVLAHMPSGSKTYHCQHPGCDWSFTLKHQLKAHEKTHDPTRYMCSHPDHDEFPNFPTWTALQAHMHEVHAPTCPHPECHGRTFKSAQRLKDHLKVHGERSLDLDNVVIDSDMPNGLLDGTGSRKRRRKSVAAKEEPAKLRRLVQGQAGKEWACTHENCEKRFKTKFALASHVTATHRGKRHTCTMEGCDKAFAHLSSLQKHLASHDTPPTPSRQAKMEDEDLTREMLTGSRLALRQFACPVHLIYDDPLSAASMSQHTAGGDVAEGSKDIVGRCGERFHRVYDVRRHLKSEHDVDLQDMEVRLLLARGGQHA